MRLLLTVLLLPFFCSTTYSQEKNFIDQPYLETTASVDTLVMPDKIYISIVLNEADSKNKKSTEEQEKLLEQKLKDLNINIGEDLSLLDYTSSFKSYFLKGQNILKAKNYSLLVRDAVVAGNVLAELEDIGISNINIERTEYSQADELILALKAKAISMAKFNATKLTEPLNQKIGKAIYITDHSTLVNSLQGKSAGIQIRGVSSIYGSRAAEPILIDFQKIKFEAQVTVKFIIL